MPRKRILVVGRRGAGKSSACNLLTDGVEWIAEGFNVSSGPNSSKTTWGFIDSKVLPISLHDSTGLDGTLDTHPVVSEIAEIIKTAPMIDGLLFVLEFGRVDDWDTGNQQPLCTHNKGVFYIFLEGILKDIPSSLVGVVFTKSPDKYLADNNMDSYIQENGAHPLYDKLRKRSDNKFCFIQNPRPKEEVFTKQTIHREKSLANVQTMINQFKGRIK